MSLSIQASEKTSFEWFHNQAVCFNYSNDNVMVKSLQNFSTPGIYCSISTFPVSTPIQMTATGFSEHGNAFLWAYLPKYKTRVTTNYTLLPVHTTGSVTTTFTLPSWASGTPVYTGVLFTAPHIGDEFTLSSLTFSSGGGGGGGGGTGTSDLVLKSLSINNNIYLDKVLDFSKKYLDCIPDYDTESCSNSEVNDELPCYIFDEEHQVNKDDNFLPCRLNEMGKEPLTASDPLQKDLETLFQLQENLSNAMQCHTVPNTSLPPVTVTPPSVHLSNFNSFLSKLV